MSPTRLITAVSAAALMGALASPALAQAPQPKTEAAAKAQTGKPSTDAPAGTAVQGTAKAVKEAAPASGAAQPATAQAPAAQTAPAAAPGAALAKPVAVQGDLVDTLKLSGQFTTFVQGIDATNLTGLLKQNKNLTVFAPTEAAFAAMPAAELAKLKADKAAMQKFILRHVVNAPIDTSKIKGAKGPVPSGAGDQILLDGSDEAALKVDGATILQADLRTGSGLLHVVDHVLPEGLGGDPTMPAATGDASPTAAEGTKAKQ